MQLRFAIIAVIVSILIVLGSILAIYYIRPNDTMVTSSSETTTSQSSSTNFSIGAVLHIPTASALAVHVRYFYYNSTEPRAYIFSGGNQILVQGSSGGVTFSAASRFTIQSDAGSVLMGGPDNQSEGTAVNYLIFLKAPSNGTYTFNLGWLYPELNACGVDFQLSMGNGNPNYGWAGSCTAPLSEQYRVNSDGLVNGFLFAEIIGVSNATLPSNG